MIGVPRTLQEILDNAETLAQQFEDLPGDEEVLDAAPLRRIREAAQSRAAAERALATAIADARGQGLSWAVIGAYVGTSGEAARQRYGGTGPAAAQKIKVKKAAVKKVSPRVRTMPQPRKVAAKKGKPRAAVAQRLPRKRSAGS